MLRLGPRSCTHSVPFAKRQLPNSHCLSKLRARSMASFTLQCGIDHIITPAQITYTSRETRPQRSMLML